MVATTNAIAKIAAVVAGLGLVAMSFASFAAPAKAATLDELNAQLQALMSQIAALQGTSTSVSTTFTMDLTIGSSGAEVTALQNWLISKGYSIPAGATGYFGAQTQSALAAFQAANGISPAAGYFGPITRAKVNAMAGGSTGSTGGTSTGGLSGGEADLRNYDLISGEDLMEGDSNTEIALAKFDVDGGDARIQRVTVDMQPNSASYNEHPWEYVDSLSVYLNDKKIGDVDAGSKSDWDQQNADSAHNDGANLDYYTIDIPVDGVVSEGDRAELSVRADAQSTIDSSDQNQTFYVQIADDGIRAVDSQGIQQYTGNDGETVTLGFDAAESGDITVRKSSDTPTAGTLVVDDTETSDEFDVLKFEMKNSQSADADLNEIVVRVATSTAGDIKNYIRRATLTVNGNDYSGDVSTTGDGTIDFDNLDETINGDDTTDFTLSVELYGANHTGFNLPQTLTFSVDSADVDAEGSDTGDTLTGSDLTGSADGYVQTLALNGGITVEGNDMSSALTYNSNTPSASYGTFTVKLDVTANGDDVYVPKTIGSTTAASSTYNGVVVSEDMGTAVGAGTTTSTLTTTADSDNSLFYVVHDGDTETFTATVTINPSADGDFQVGLDKVRFSTSDSDLNSLQTVDVDQTNSDFHTDPLHIPNS
jgi:peptidoglycan hydrolase-like protein with peptidoglycan-binding domain